MPVIAPESGAQTRRKSRPFGAKLPPARGRRCAGCHKMGRHKALRLRLPLSACGKFRHFFFALTGSFLYHMYAVTRRVPTILGVRAYLHKSSAGGCPLAVRARRICVASRVVALPHSRRARGRGRCPRGDRRDTHKWKRRDGTRFLENSNHTLAHSSSRCGSHT